MIIRPAQPSDAAAIWSIIGPVIRAGETYTLDRDMSEAEAIAYWMGGEKETFVAEESSSSGASELLGTYYIRPNQAGGGRHVANCGYMTNATATGRGVARAMCAHSLEHAKARGFRAMQSNFVVSTNGRAVCLWEPMGFEVVGWLAGAFKSSSRRERSKNKLLDATLRSGFMAAWCDARLRSRRSTTSRSRSA